MVVLSPYRQNVADPVSGHKTTSYFSRMLALQIAHSKGAAEALWFTTSNFLAEGCISNVFLIKDSVIYTPTISTPVLAGIARKTILRITQRNCLKLVEKDLDIEELLSANEIFLTNVIMKVLPVIGVEKHTVGNGKVGPVVKNLQKLYDQFIKDFCGKKK
jgi:branched-subunit amino acid aminotransferase/4-amino-4-deoxychorismate lyase